MELVKMARAVVQNLTALEHGPQEHAFAATSDKTWQCKVLEHFRDVGATSCLGQATAPV
jgi:hypothetical protein